jgi:hypothetical protein
MKKLVLCTIKNRNQGEPLVRKLQASGYANEDIAVLFPNDLAGTRADTVGETKAPELAIVGGALGMTLGFFAGLAAIALGIPMVATLLAGSTFVVCMITAMGGTIAGAAAGALLGLGLPENRVERSGEHLHGGKLLISVHTEVEDLRAERMFIDAGAEDVYSTRASYDSPSPGLALAPA